MLSCVRLFATQWDFPGQNTGVGSHPLLQGIFPTQVSNPDLPHCRLIFYHLNDQESPFLSDQCRHIEENNRVGKPRDLLKKIKDTKGTFHAKMGTIKDRNGMDLTEAEDIQKRWQEYTEELYKKDLHQPDNHDGGITHLETDILECKVNRALGSITENKASGDDGIPAELFQILKDDAVKMPYSICQKIWKTQQWPQDRKRSVFIPISKKGNAKECSNCCIIALSFHTLAK